MDGTATLTIELSAVVMKTAVSRIGRSHVLPPAFGPRAASPGATSVHPPNLPARARSRTCAQANGGSSPASTALSCWLVPVHLTRQVVVSLEPFSALMT